MAHTAHPAGQAHPHVNVFSSDGDGNVSLTAAVATVVALLEAEVTGDETDLTPL